MISRIKGILLDISDNTALVEAFGLGYDITLPPCAAESLSTAVGSEVTLFTYHYILGGSMTTSSVPMLIGFLNKDDKAFFERFITVPGIGPKAAVKAMVLNPQEIAKAIEYDDVKVLKSMPGIGDRTAREIIATLKGKVTAFMGVPGLTAPTPAAPSKGKVTESVPAEAVLVLEQLGYRRSEAEKMVAEVAKRMPEIKQVGEIVQQVYRLGIGGNR